MSTREVSKAQFMDDQIKVLQVQARVMEQEKENQAEKMSRMEETIENMRKMLETQMSSHDTMMKETTRRMNNMKMIMDTLQEENRYYREMLEEKREQMRQFLQDKHEEIEAITLKYEAELAGHDRVLQELLNQNNDLKRTVSDMKKLLKTAGIEGGVAVPIFMIGFLCGVPALSVGCAVGVAGLAVDGLRHVVKAFNA